MAVLCSPWHSFCTCSMPGILDFVVFKTLTFDANLTFLFLFFSFCALHAPHVLISPLQDCNFFHDDLAYREHVLICSFVQNFLEIYLINPDVL